MGDISTYLTTLTVPDITSVDFASDFTTFVNNINSNFQKIVSAPYLKGDKGDNVQIKHEPLYKSDGNHEFTTLGATLVNTIYDGVVIVTSSDTYADLLTKLDTTNDRLGGDVYSCIQLDPYTDGTFNNIFIDVFYDIYDNTLTFVSVYFFLDARNNTLESIDDTEKINYVDHSCGVYGSYASGAWSLDRYNVVPTLYYDAGLGEFCWTVNGQKSGITAQGLKGQDGADANLFVCTGVEVESTTTDNVTVPTRIVLNDIISSTSSEYIPGSLAVCWFDSEPIDAGDISQATSGYNYGEKFLNLTASGSYQSMYVYTWNGSDWDASSGHPVSINQLVLDLTDNKYKYFDGVTLVECELHDPNVTFGIIQAHHVTDEVTSYYIDYRRSYDVQSIIANMTLRDRLNDVGAHSPVTDPHDVRGLYIRSELGSPVPSSSEDVHMIYSTPDTTTNPHTPILNLRKVTYEDTNQSTNIPTTAVPKSESRLNLDYGRVTMLGNHTDPAVEFNAEDGLIMKKDSSPSHFFNLSGKHGILKLFEEPNTNPDREGVLVFMPFSSIDVGPMPDGISKSTSLKLGLPYLGYMQFDGVGYSDTICLTGINPNLNSTINNNHYNIYNKQSMTCDSDFIYISLPSTTPSVNTNYTKSEPFVVTANYKIGNNEYTSKLVINLLIQNLGFYSDIKRKRVVYLVDYCIQPYRTGGDETVNINDLNRLYWLISHQQPINWSTSLYTPVTRMRFFLTCEPTNSNSIITVLSFDPAAAIFYENESPHEDDSTPKSLNTLKGITLPTIDIPAQRFANWHWAYKSADITSLGFDIWSYDSNYTMIGSFDKNDSTTPIKGTGGSIVRENCFDTFSSVLRYYNQNNSLEYEGLLTETNIDRFVLNRYSKTNSSTPLLTISNFPDNDNQTAYSIHYLIANSPSSYGSLPGYVAIKEQDPEWLYINNQPVDIGTNRIAAEYTQIKYTTLPATYNNEYVDPYTGSIVPQ